MNRQDRASALRDQFFNSVRIDRVVVRSDVAEDRRETFAHNSVGGGGKCKWRSDDLSG